MSKNKQYRNKGFLIFGAAILAAAWMIGGPDALQRFDLHPKVVGLLTWIPTITVFFWSISGNRKFIACERRAFKRLLGLS